MSALDSTPSETDHLQAGDTVWTIVRDQGPWVLVESRSIEVLRMESPGDDSAFRTTIIHRGWLAWDGVNYFEVPESILTKTEPPGLFLPLFIVLILLALAIFLYEVIL